jgi:hypothetical protein
MKITVDFSPHGGKEETSWFRDISDFPKLLRWQGAVYEFVMYNQNGFWPSTDYTFNFSETKNYTQKYYEIASFSEMFRSGSGSGCQCGAKYDKGNPQHHMFYCPNFKPTGEKK